MTRVLVRKRGRQKSSQMMMKTEEREINLKCYIAGIKNTEKGYLPRIAGSLSKLKKARK